ncbi:roadblock/LC7 domain-containing protein [Streptomyces ipomoeae]|uniref:RarB (Conservon) homologue n=5 Tax=Streptomyces TaxID=1883 RepID=C9ZDF2_STRSW|nr:MULTISPECIES: roadblock/LC7 domain-containing protein [Streptomyces]MBP5861358.1 roadblock/LC7 domain-containing protein [Streptomyces sp. LBUM 1484]MBP5869709.1 roadblock/LC7 domain-containing protein [Streptomyces sp. LBUM 1485]MBP5886045.1 roadblock/LC7 domain-containing protein [Streptomyces sp. LBUM 1487]MBP5928904.1 roadblock/LC7 domain-containing protein [Streptomyces sp. LBUM 1479]MDX2682873.1 roadblock/LC7 domain-containing protein [Streptomyces sp. NY05-11A]QTU48367.1 roadblock/L
MKAPVQQDLKGWAERLVEVPGVQLAMFFTDDGLKAGGSTNLHGDAQAGAAAMASGMFSTALATVRALNRLPDTAEVALDQITVEVGGQFLIVMAAGNHTNLAVWTEARADIGNVAFEMANLIGRIGAKAFDSPAREHR